MIENKSHAKNTLHSNYRKRELDKIEAENYKLAQKLFSLKSDLTKKHFDRDFMRHNNYKMNLQKIKKRSVPVQDGRHGHLPPLADEDRKHFDEINEALDAEHDVKIRNKKNTQSSTRKQTSGAESNRKPIQKVVPKKNEYEDFDGRENKGDITGAAVNPVAE